MTPKRLLAFGVALAAIGACSAESGGKAHPVLSHSPLPDLAGRGRVTGTFRAVCGPYGAPDASQRGRILCRHDGSGAMTVHVAQVGKYSFLLAPGRYSLVGYTPQFTVDGHEGACLSYPQTFNVRAGDTKRVDVLCQRA